MAAQVPTRLNALQSTLVRRERQVASVLPAHIQPRKFLRTVMTAASHNPDIAACDQQSIIQSCMKAASDGLLLDGREAALVPFKGKAQYIPMVFGVLKRARNSGQLSSVSAHVVYERDRFAYVLGDDERIEHEPCLGGHRGKSIAVYAIARLKDGTIVREVMSATEVEEIRQNSPARDKDPWKKHWGEMARKTVLRRIAKYLPSSADLMVDGGSANDDGEDWPVIDADATDEQQRPAGGAAAMENVAQQAQQGQVIDGEAVDPETGELTRTTTDPGAPDQADRQAAPHDGSNAEDPF